MGIIDMVHSILFGLEIAKFTSVWFGALALDMALCELYKRKLVSSYLLICNFYEVDMCIKEIFYEYESN
jgi:hypothetical protein